MTTASEAVRDVNAPFDLWRLAHQDLKTREESLVNAFDHEHHQSNSG